MSSKDKKWACLCDYMHSAFLQCHSIDLDGITADVQQGTYITVGDNVLFKIMTAIFSQQLKKLISDI